MASANTAMGRMTENVQMSLSSIRRRTIWTLVMYQISFLHSIPLRRFIARVHVSVSVFSVSVRFYVLLTFWLIFLLLLDSRSAIQISWTCCSLSSRCWQDLRGATSASQRRHPSQIRALHSPRLFVTFRIFSRGGTPNETIGEAETQIFQRRLRQDVLDDLLISMVTENNLAFRPPRNLRNRRARPRER